MLLGIGATKLSVPDNIQRWFENSILLSVSLQRENYLCYHINFSICLEHIHIVKCIWTRFQKLFCLWNLTTIITEVRNCSCSLQCSFLSTAMTGNICKSARFSKISIRMGSFSIEQVILRIAVWQLVPINIIKLRRNPIEILPRNFSRISAPSQIVYYWKLCMLLIYAIRDR